MLLFQATPAAATTLEQLQQQLVDLTTQLAELRAQSVILDRQIRRADGVVRAQLLDQRAQLNAQIDGVNAQIRAVRSQIAARQGQAQPTIAVPPAPPTPPNFPIGRQFDPDLVMIFFIAIVFCIGLPISIGIAKRLMRGRPAAPVPKQDDIAPRLERLEQAVDAIAIEVERISEGQRFVTKILSEKQPTPALGAGPIDPIRSTDRAPDKERVNK